MTKEGEDEGYLESGEKDRYPVAWLNYRLIDRHL